MGENDTSQSLKLKESYWSDQQLIEISPFDLLPFDLILMKINKKTLLLDETPISQTVPLEQLQSHIKELHSQLQSVNVKMILRNCTVNYIELT